MGKHNMMKFSSVLLAGCLLATPLAAQTANSDAVAVSGSGSQASINNVQNTPDRVDTTVPGIAPGLTAAGVHSCAGSASVGVGGTGFGFGFGSTHEMKECNRRAYAAQLLGMGANGAALDLICQNGEVRAALNNTGVVCPHQQVQEVASTGSVAAAPPRVVESRDFRPAELKAHGCEIAGTGADRHYWCPNGFPTR